MILLFIHAFPRKKRRWCPGTDKAPEGYYPLGYPIEAMRVPNVLEASIDLIAMVGPMVGRTPQRTFTLSMVVRPEPR